MLQPGANLNASSNGQAPAPRNRRPWPYAPPPQQPLPATLPGEKPWPKISVITPSFNQGQYIEETILSVLNQGYPNLEYLVIDGGSSDQTMSVVDRYRSRIAWVESEKDRGQSHAINKGFARCTGEFCTWVNSDDMLLPGALARMALAFATNATDVVAGICTLHSGGKVTNRHLTGVGSDALAFDELLEVDRWLGGQFFYQPEVMFSRDLWDRAGGKLDESLFYTMDCDLWLRFAQASARLHVIGQPICLFRVHDQQKTFSATDFRPELESLSRRYAKQTSQTPRAIDKPTGLPRPGIRVVFFNDCGNQNGAGVALQRAAASMALGGHDVVCLAAIFGPTKSSLSTQQILDAIGERKPDLVILGDLSGAQLDPALPGQIVSRWATVRLADAPAPTDQLPLTINPGHGLPLHIFKPRDKSACRDLLHLPQDRFIVLFVAQNIANPAKGLQRLIEAIQSLKLPEALIITVGRCETVPQAEGVEIRNAGYIADPQKLAMYYSAADLYVSPDLAPTTGQSCLEAAACGTPSIAFADSRPTIAEGISGTIVPGSTIGDLAATIGQFHGNPQLRQDMSVWGRMWVENEHSLAALYHRLFNQLKFIGLAEKLNLPLRIYFKPDETLPPALVYLEQSNLPQAQSAAEDPYGFLVAWDAERQSMRTALNNITQTRLWRMVNYTYPFYHRLTHGSWLPRFARRGIQSVGDWLAQRPK